MKDYKAWCNICNGETTHDENGCAYHQMTLYDSEGIPYPRYDEFNDEGE